MGVPRTVMPNSSQSSRLSAALRVSLYFYFPSGKFPKAVGTLAQEQSSSMRSDHTCNDVSCVYAHSHAPHMHMHCDMHTLHLHMQTCPSSRTHTCMHTRMHMPHAP